MSAHRLMVKVVVMVVGDQPCIDGGHLAQWYRNRMQSAGTGPLRWRHPPAPHRVDQQSVPVDLDHRAEVVEPGDGQ